MFGSDVLGSSLLMAFILIFPRKFVYWEFCSLVLLSIYAIVSGSATGSVLGIALTICYFVMFRSNYRIIGFLIGICVLAPFMLVTLGMNMDLAADNSSGIGRLVANLSTMLEQYRGESVQSGNSGFERLSMLTTGLELARQHPLMGVGLDNAKYWWTPTMSYAYGDGLGTHLHNSYLELVVSLGVPLGLGLLAYLFVKYSRKQRKISYEYSRLVRLFMWTLLLFMLTNTIYKDMVLVFMSIVILTARNNFIRGNCV